MPSAPRAQLIGAMLAPAQIHICCGPVESLSVSGMGSILWTSTLSSAPASVAMIVPLAPVGVRLRRVVGTESTAARHPARHLPLALGIHGAGYREMFLAHTNAPADHLHGQRGRQTACP